MVIEDTAIRELNSPEFDFLLLADRAEAINGKLYVMGGAWDRLTVQNFQLPSLISIAMGILVPWNACNVQQVLRLQIVDSDEQAIGFQAQLGFITGRPPWIEQGAIQRTLLAIPALGVKFPGPGNYVLVASINDAGQKRARFTVLQAQQSLPGPIQPAPP